MSGGNRQSRAGKRTTKRAPRPSSGSASDTFPPWERATARTIARPSPEEPLRSPADIRRALEGWRRITAKTVFTSADGGERMHAIAQIDSLFRGER